MSESRELNGRLVVSWLQLALAVGSLVGTGLYTVAQVGSKTDLLGERIESTNVALGAKIDALNGNLAKLSSDASTRDILLRDLVGRVSRLEAQVEVKRR